MCRVAPNATCGSSSSCVGHTFYFLFDFHGCNRIRYVSAEMEIIPMVPACGTDGHSNYLLMFQQVPQQHLTPVTSVICRKGTAFVFRRAPCGFSDSFRQRCLCDISFGCSSWLCQWIVYYLVVYALISKILASESPLSRVVKLDRLPVEWITQLHNGCFVALVQRCPARVSGA